jgi:hypothetical protein
VGLLIAILTLLLVALVVAVVSAPLRRANRVPGPGSPTGVGERAGEPLLAPSAANTREELDAAREAKYREIRDAELDYRTGKLSREDYETIDAELRAEAIEILDRVERAQREAAPGADGAGP